MSKRREKRVGDRKSAAGVGDSVAFRRIMATLNERQRRHLAGREALRLGWGGIKRVMKVTGLSYPTIRRGIREVQAGEAAVLEGGRARKPGGGRKRTEERRPRIKAALQRLVEPETGGDPCSRRKWTRSSLRRLAQRLSARGYRVGKDTVRRLLQKGASA